jgi:hypothetical protein
MCAGRAMDSQKEHADEKDLLGRPATTSSTSELSTKLRRQLQRDQRRSASVDDSSPMREQGNMKVHL